MSAEGILNSINQNNVTGYLVTAAVLFVTWFVTKSFVSRTKGKLPPGPYGLPLFGALPLLGNEPHKVLWGMKKKYGDVIGLYFGRDYTVILNDYILAKDILLGSDALDRPNNLFGKKPNIGFNTDNGPKWVEQRRFCMSAARDLGLGRGHWEDIIMEAASEFSHSLHPHYTGKPTEISQPLVESLASNIVGMIIGRKLDRVKENEKVKMFVQFNEYSFTFVGPSLITSILPFMRTVYEVLRIRKYDEAAKVIKQFSKFVRGEISRHKTSSELQNVHDFVNTYLEEIEKKKGNTDKKHFFSEENLEGNMNILFLASSDTVFSSIQWLTRLMAKHPAIQERVYQEVTREIPNRVARYEDRNTIPYTFATLMESQRMSSIVPLSTTRRSARDIQIGEYSIPKGTHISANFWGLHHDPKYWDEPDEFRPERHLSEDGSKFNKNPPSFAPFSLGRRNCPGETIAYMTIMAYFTEIIKKFEISIPPGEKLEFNTINGLVTRLTPQNLIYTPRNTK